MKPKFTVGQKVQLRKSAVAAFGTQVPKGARVVGIEETSIKIDNIVYIIDLTKKKYGFPLLDYFHEDYLKKG